MNSYSFAEFIIKSGKIMSATKIPIEGNFKNPHVKTLYAVWEVLRNAFIQALMPQIDNDINIHSVKTNKADKESTTKKRVKRGDNEQQKK